MAVTDRRTRRAAEKPERLNARLSAEQKRVLEKAAALKHQPLSQFVISSAQRAAERVIREHEVISLSVRDSQSLMDALRNPGPPSPTLLAADERYKTFMGE